MKRIFPMVGIAFAFVILQGCGTPELERTPYGQDEVRWEGFIRSNYTGWDSPQSVPPSAMDEPLSSADLPALPPLPEISTVPVEPPPPASAETYTVSKGDTLWSISKKFYGKGGNWQVILDANKDKLPDPNKLKAGTVISIPPKP